MDIIKIVKENWIGGLIGGIIGFMNIGVTWLYKYLTGWGHPGATLIPSNLWEWMFRLNLPPCNCNGLPGCMCADVIMPEMYAYSVVFIIILIVLGMFIQSALIKYIKR